MGPLIRLNFLTTKEYMNASKQKYVDLLRANTAYPEYRSVIGVVSYFCYVVTFCITVAPSMYCLFYPKDVEFKNAIFIIALCLLLSGLLLFIIKFFVQWALMQADTADATINSSHSILKTNTLMKEKEISPPAAARMRG
jgi:hypothetical protein